MIRRTTVIALILVLAVGLRPADTPADPNARDGTPAAEQPTTAEEQTAATRPADAEPPQELGLLDLMALSTEDQRARVLRYIRNRYPTLSTELLALLQTRHPGIFVELEREIEALIATRYPTLPLTVQRSMQRAITERFPQARRDITEMIAERYPEVLEAMFRAGEGDPSLRVGKIIQEKHPGLLDDILTLLRERYPTMLEEVNRDVLVAHPALVADVGRLISKRYPRLAHEVTVSVTRKYPELVPGILEILRPDAANGEQQPDAQEETAPDAEEPA